jgi:uncharacterized protein YciI
MRVKITLFLPLLPLIVLLPGLLPAQDQTEIYHIVFFRPDPARKPISKEEDSRIMAAHLGNIHSMADRGLLVAAGKPTTISGVFFLKTDSLDQARRLAALDPTVVEHRLIINVYPWRGQKGLGDEYTRRHEEDPKTPEDMGIQPFVMLYRTDAWDEKAASLKDHGSYVAQLIRDQKLATAGPILGDGRLAEIIIFNRIPDDEAGKLASSDPAVKSGLYRVAAHRWWSAAHVLPELPIGVPVRASLNSHAHSDQSRFSCHGPHARRLERNALAAA